jgi:hypothetical protein
MDCKNRKRFAFDIYVFVCYCQPKILCNTSNISSLVIGRSGYSLFHHADGTPLIYHFSFARLTALYASEFSSLILKSTNNPSTLISLKSNTFRYLRLNTPFFTNCSNTSNDISNEDIFNSLSLFFVFRSRLFPIPTTLLLKSIFHKKIACHRLQSLNP